MTAADSFHQFASLGAIVLGCILGYEVASLVLLLAHELAHALVGRLVGFRVLSAHFGFGPPVRVFWPFGLRVTLHRSPRGGHVVWQPRGRRWLRTRYALTVLAGPFANLAVAAAALPGLSAVMSGGVMQMGFAGVFSATFGVVAAAWAFAGLWPWQVPGRPVSDASLALGGCRSSDAAWQQSLDDWRQYAIRHDLWDALLRADYTELHKQIDAGEAESPEEPAWWSMRAIAALAGGDAIGALKARHRTAEVGRRALDAMDAEMEPPERREAARAYRATWESNQVQNHAFFLAHTDRDGDLESAERICVALREDGEDPGANAARLRTHGMILLRLGRVDEGMEKLEAAYAMPEEFWQRAMCAGYLAYGHALRGDRKMARRFLRKARRLGARNPLVDIGERWTEAALAGTENLAGSATDRRPRGSGVRDDHAI